MDSTGVACCQLQKINPLALGCVSPLRPDKSQPLFDWLDAGRAESLARWLEMPSPDRWMCRFWLQAMRYAQICYLDDSNKMIALVHELLLMGKLQDLGRCSCDEDPDKGALSRGKTGAQSRRVQMTGRTACYAICTSPRAKTSGEAALRRLLALCLHTQSLGHGGCPFCRHVGGLYLPLIRRMSISEAAKSARNERFPDSWFLEFLGIVVERELVLF